MLGRDHCVTEMQVPKMLVGRSLREVDLRRKYGLTMLAVKRGERLNTLPAADYVFANDDLLVLVGSTQDLHIFSEAMA